MLEARLLLASCLTTALVAVPLGSPAGAQEDPQFDCFVSPFQYVFVPESFTIWDLYETDGYTWTIRGDRALLIVNELTSAWADTTTGFVSCVQAYAEAVAADALQDASGALEAAADAADSLLACVTDAATPLLESDPLTSRYVEPGLDGIVHVHLGAVVDDAVALWNCNGVFVLGG
jgi:hypothetical protein